MFIGEGLHGASHGLGCGPSLRDGCLRPPRFVVAANNDLDTGQLTERARPADWFVCGHTAACFAAARRKFSTPLSAADAGAPSVGRLRLREL